MDRIHSPAVAPMSLPQNIVCKDVCRFSAYPQSAVRGKFTEFSGHCIDNFLPTVPVACDKVQSVLYQMTVKICVPFRRRCNANVLKDDGIFAVKQ